MSGSIPDAEVNSAINKVAKSLYNLVSKKKNRNKGQDWILEQEKDFLEGLKFDARKRSVEGEENELRSQKRKEFEEACRMTKHRRVKKMSEDNSMPPFEELPVEIKANLIIADMLSCIDHLIHMRMTLNELLESNPELGTPMGEMMQHIAHEHEHEHDENCNHDHDHKGE